MIDFTTSAILLSLSFTHTLSLSLSHSLSLPLSHSSFLFLLFPFLSPSCHIFRSPSVFLCFSLSLFYFHPSLFLFLFLSLSLLSPSLFFPISLSFPPFSLLFECDSGEATLLRLRIMHLKTTPDKKLLFRGLFHQHV